MAITYVKPVTSGTQDLVPKKINESIVWYWCIKIFYFSINYNILVWGFITVFLRYPYCIISCNTNFFLYSLNLNYSSLIDIGLKVSKTKVLASVVVNDCL